MPALVALGALLRVINVNAELWFDEIVTVINFVEPPLATVLTTYGLANNHVLNSALMNIAGDLLGTEPWMLRLPAVLFGIAGVWAFYFAASASWSRTPAVVGTLLFAVSYHHVYYTQNARGYSALVFFTLVATGCGCRLVDRGRAQTARDGAGYAVAVGVGLYAMLLGAFVALGHALVFAALRRWRALMWLGGGIALAVALYAPMGESLIAYHRAHPADTGYPLLSRRFLHLAAPAVPLLLACALLLPMARRLLRQRPAVAALLLLPAIVNVCVPLLRGQGVYPRSFIYLLPLGYLLLVEAIEQLLPRYPRLTVGGAVVAAAVSVAALIPYYQLPKQGFRQALAYLEAHAAPGEERIGISLAGKAARYYDKSVRLVEEPAQLPARTGRSSGAWVLSTFHAQLRTSDPALYAWLERETVLRAEFPGVIGDGTVRVHYWALPAR